MADFTPTAVAKSSNFVPGASGDTTAEVLTDLLANRTETYGLITSVSQQFYSGTAPSNPNTGMVWYDSANSVLKRWSGTGWDVESGGGGVSVISRNSILQANVSATGDEELFAIGTGLACNLNATAIPCVVSWMDGNDLTGGQKNLVGVIDADASAFWSSLPTNNKAYLYIELVGSTISGGYSTVAPKTQAYAPTHSAGLDWINFNQGEVYNSNGSAWTKKYRVYVGEAVTNGSAVTSITNYHYGVSALDVYDLPWTAGIVLPYFSSGDISAQLPFPRNGKITNIRYFPTGTPSASTDINVFLISGNSIDGALNSSATSISLASSITLYVATNMIIDNEVVQITAIGGTALSGTALSGTALTIVRAAQGTVAAAHDSGTLIGLQISTVALSAKTSSTVTLSTPVSVLSSNYLVFNVYGAGLAGISVTCVAGLSNG